tara:strand:- start:50668 stop:51639 length:972 start_codon:yes stop_codon:yes gene_type:complete
MSKSEKGLQTLMDNLNKSIGEQAIVKLGDADRNVERIPTGSLEANYVLGGGWAKGRVLEVFGWESSGKTTLALHTIAECQQSGGVAAFIDMEHALDPEWAGTIGVDVGNLVFMQPDNGEQALETVDQMCRSGEVDLIVIDSVAALVPKSELEGEMGDANVGKHARLMSQAMRKIPNSAQKTGTTVLFINQMRMKIGVMFGNPETTTGGNALKFFASQRLEVRKRNPKKDNDGEKLSNIVALKCVKNKVSAPFLESETVITYGLGIDTVWEVLQLSVEADIIKKAGSWFSYDSTKLGQGQAAVLALLRDNPELLEEIKNKVLNL